MVVEEECRNMDEVKLKSGKCDSPFAERSGSDAGDVSYDEVVIYNAYKAYPEFEIHDEKWDRKVYPEREFDLCEEVRRIQSFLCTSGIIK